MRIGEDKQSTYALFSYILLAKELLGFGVTEIAYRLRKETQTVKALEHQALYLYKNRETFAKEVDKLKALLIKGVSIDYDPEWTD